MSGTLLLAAALAFAGAPQSDDGAGRGAADGTGVPSPDATGDDATEDVDPEVAAQAVTGLEEGEQLDGDTAREVGEAILWLPRNAVDYAFRGAEAAANIVAEEQLVPRYRRLLGIPEGGQLFVFPTLFAETGSAFNVGLRMIMNSRYVTTSQRFGIGGLRDWVSESRVLLEGGPTVPFALSLEALGQSREDRAYGGVGAVPSLDERNQFRPGRAGQRGRYREERSRFITSLGMRLSPELELYVSTSAQRRRVSEVDPEDRPRLADVFVEGSVPGVEQGSWISYSEVAARFDSRATRGRPVPGVLLEGYGGGAKSILGPPVAFLRLGWRVASFISIYRRGNVLGARLVVDRLVPLSGLPVPFQELPRQPDYRGLQDRRDLVSMVGSVDYTWLLLPVLGMRAFLDAAVVAPAVTELGVDSLRHMRLAPGLGVDLFTETSRIAQFAVAGSPDGARVLLRFGTPNGYGDRQHRE